MSCSGPHQAETWDSEHSRLTETSGLQQPRLKQVLSSPHCTQATDFQEAAYQILAPDK